MNATPAIDHGCRCDMAAAAFALDEQRRRCDRVGFHDDAARVPDPIVLNRVDDACGPVAM
jgi:hypothetical protein